MEKKMDLDSDFYKSLLENIDEGIYFVDIHHNVIFWNKAAELITGFSAQEMLGKNCADNTLNHVNDEGDKLCISGCPLHDSLVDYKRRCGQMYLHHKDGHRVRISTKISPVFKNGEIIGAMEVFKQIMDNNLTKNNHEEDHYSMEELKLMALYDPLTKIPNRRYVESFIDSKILEYRNLGIHFGILFMDIDNFRDFNNQYGHDTGDRILQMSAKTFNNAIRKSDIIGRWGGEEFIGVFTAISEEALYIVAEKIRMLIENSVIRKCNKNLNVTISIGGTMVKPDDDTTSIIKRADDQMYKSKKNGKNQVHIG